MNNLINFSEIINLKNISTELNILDIGDICLISNEIEKLVENDEKVTHIGHCKMFESSKILNVNPKDFDIDNVLPQDTLIITNPVILSSIFLDYNYCLRNIAKKINNQFIFTVPSFGKKSEIEIYWGTGFSYMETDNKKYSRWFASRTDTIGKIFIYNHSKRIKKIKTHLEIYTLDRFSSVKISYVNQGGGGVHSNFYEANDNIINFEENILLFPGKNEIAVEYFGDIYIRTEGDIRPLLFKVIDFHIEGDYSVYDSDAYRQTSNEFFLEYFEDEEKIRSCLHASGFYDVISWESIENRELLKSKYTRYFVCDLLYREVKCYSKNYDGEDLKLNLFLAKRKGIFNE
jgi:hypothetical protein